MVHWAAHWATQVAATKAQSLPSQTRRTWELVLLKILFCRVLFMVSTILATLACAWGIQSQKPVANSAVTASQSEFFETKIRPLLVAICYSCHGPDKQLGGLRLDSRAAISRGGGRGPAISSGAAEASLLLKAVSYADPVLKMPP